ncbi:TetR/AcrR family transcriptional regulator [Nocardioides sp. GY 10127]|uniref:TetR/AcrR family transcriptional regulator n=1 Tax=Nocardioides sp. GY 10127 TaxID=2569762 RepID=UPI0010A85436|nr:TetR/AcrR family transcriptional regulator [Nocardioides sp. GY 10127]TIC80015.1 TetR/AcrR family transcriptional regulator [Nocardioides sp. GY 10127]
MTRRPREALLERVTDHVLEHGVVGLTLRPVAAAVGTSDRMLVYHFGTRDDLVMAVVLRTEERSIAAIDALPAASGVRAGVNALWRAYQTEPLASGLRVYLQAAATGLLGQEPHRSGARAGGERWVGAIRAYLVRCGVPAERAPRVTALVDSSLYGFHLDLVTDTPDELAQGVDDLAVAAAALADLSLAGRAD